MTTPPPHVVLAQPQCPWPWPSQGRPLIGRCASRNRVTSPIVFTYQQHTFKVCTAVVRFFLQFFNFLTKLSSYLNVYSYHISFLPSHTKFWNSHIPQGGGGQSDKKMLPCADHALNFTPFSRIAMLGKSIPFSRIFHGEISEWYPFQGYIFLNHPFQGLTRIVFWS